MTSQGELLGRVQRTLGLNQRELGELMGCSARTIMRGGGVMTPATYAALATACHPHDAGLAAELAAKGETTLVALGLASAGPGAPSPRHLADSIVCAAAEAMQSPPQAMRPALLAAFERAAALGLTLEQALEALTTPKPSKTPPRTSG